MFKYLKSVRENYYLSAILAAIARPIHSASIRLSAQIERKVKRNSTTIRLPNGRLLRVARDAGVNMASLLFWKGLDGYEAQTSEIVRYFVERISTFVDVGANYGFYSLLAALWNPGVRVVAFEPVPPIYDGLVRNIKLNGLDNQISAQQFALADRTGTATLYLPRTEGRDYETTGTLVSDICHSELSVPRTIKIDVEDFEASVLAGMEQTVRRDRPFIICEILPRHHRNERTRQIVESLGYTPYWITRAGLIRVSRFDFERRSSQDFLLSPVSVPGEVITDMDVFLASRSSNNTVSVDLHSR